MRRTIEGTRTGPSEQSRPRFGAGGWAHERAGDTDIGREDREALPALGLGVEDACTIARNGVEAAFCPPEQEARLREEFDAVIAGLLAERETAAPRHPR